MQFVFRAIRTIYDFLTRLTLPFLILSWITLVALGWIERPCFAQFGLSGLLNPEGSRLFPQTLMVPRHPGKPDPRWRSFEWEYTDREVNHAQYRLYFYAGEEWVSRYAIPRIDEQIQNLIDLFHYTPSKQFSYLLLGSRTEFQQINIFNITEGVQGITSTTERTMAIPYWGDAETFRHISTHELVHQIQIQKTVDLSDDRSSTVLSMIPLWFVEGMAEYYSQNGVELEARQYIRDLLLYPKEEQEFLLPKFFDTGPLNFIQVYKMGQARIDFLESRFGKGTTQKILEATSKRLGEKNDKKVTFQSITLEIVKLKTPQMERKWFDYLTETYKVPADQLSQSMTEFEEIKETGDTLDIFAISPDGTLLATREIDPMTGVTMIQLRQIDQLSNPILIAEDHKPDALSFYFMQIPNLAISNSRIAYIVATTAGPEIETREINHTKDGKLILGKAHRILLHQLGIIEAHSPTLSPDGKRVAFVGFQPKGWENVYQVELAQVEKTPSPLGYYQQLTNEYFSWKNLNWQEEGIYASSNRTANQKYNLFLIKPRTSDEGISTILQVTQGKADQVSPEKSASNVDGIKNEDLLFQSWTTGSSQIHLIHGKTETQLTEAKVGLFSPALRQDQLYCMGLKSGRYHLFRIPKSKWLHKTLSTQYSKHIQPETPWKANLISLPQSEVHAYQSFITPGSFRLDDIGAFFSSGLVAGVNVDMSDLMRDYTLSAQFAYLGQLGLANTFVLFGGQGGRTKWQTGAYSILQPRLDTMFNSDQIVRTYIYRETGVIGALQYPITAFSYLDLELRFGNANRYSFSDPAIAPEWNALNPGSQWMIAPIARLGFDQVLYELYTGPLRGYGVLLEAETDFYPQPSGNNRRVRLDAAYYFQPFDRTVIAFQALGGASWGGKYRNSFLVSSDDIFRGYPVFDPRLYGDYVIGTKVEVRFPIGSLFNFPILRGMVSYDYGSIFTEGTFTRSLVSTYATGLNLHVPPLAVSFLLGFPSKTAPGTPIDSPVFHFTLRYLYL